MTEILDFLEKSLLQENPTATTKLKRNASYYVIEGEDLYQEALQHP